MQLTITNASGERIDTHFTPGAADARVGSWLVVIGHGVTGDLTRPIVADTATALNAAGYDTLRFSFSGNGDSEGDFRASTISKEVTDLGAVLDALTAEGTYPNIAYAGHSMGGAVGVLRTASDDRIKALISLAGMVDTKTFAETEFGDVTPDAGVMWEDEDCPLSSAYMTDLTTTVVNVTPAAETITVPWLLLHGTADDVVAPADTESIQALGKLNVEAIFVAGADHGFNEHKSALAAAIGPWLKRQTG